jgi:hypothetical protein
MNTEKITIITSGYQTSIRKFATVAEMLDILGRSGDLAYCYNNPDVFYKWSVAQGAWIIANI